MLANKLLGAAKVAGAANYIEDVFSTWLYTGNGATQVINNNIPLGSTVHVSLQGRTITNLGGAFSGAYPISNINDNIAEEGNANNIGFVGSGSGLFDVYVDLGTASIITSYLIAPQGTRGSAVYNTPKDFIVKASNDASTWTTIATFTSISTTYPDWDAGTYRSFSFTNTTEYRYWRLENTSAGSAGSGVAVSEWALGMPAATTGNQGLVWIKGRSGATDHALYDTVRGATFDLVSNSTAAQTTQTSGLTSFNGNGFTVNSLAKLNASAATYTSWTFRKQAKFFDVVTYTGNGSNRTISHSLGSVPGCMIIKAYSGTNADQFSWAVYHRSLNASAGGSKNSRLFLNDTSVQGYATDYWNSTDPTSTQFSLGTNALVNNNGVTYVAYLFAHDAGGFGLSGTDNVISCSSFVGTGGISSINLGYEPQWLLFKNASSGTANWTMVDNMRGWGVASSTTQNLFPNLSNAETNANYPKPTSTGFEHAITNGETCIYIAIRRGPMQTPTSGTSVFSPYVAAAQGQVTTGFPVDLGMWNYRPGYSENTVVNDRLRGVSSTDSVTNANNLVTSSTAAEAASQGTRNWNNTGFYAVASQAVFYSFRRAPGFFDVVCDTGTASGHTINHGLTVVPELMIRKKRNSATNSDWIVWHTLFSGTNKYLFLNQTDAEATNAGFWTSTAPTSTVFSVGTGSRANNLNDTYVTYLFATVAGVSKVGSYTGTGTTLTIDCGFTAGARFVLIKRTSSTGDWYVWDTARGIISGNDPYLLLNSTAAEVTNTDYIDPVNSGFQISSTAPVQINGSGGTFIFLAIA